jgi:hypothetical protein
MIAKYGGISSGRRTDGRNEKNSANGKINLHSVIAKEMGNNNES